MPQVSIIIINYNTFELTCKCIDSVYTFTKAVNFEIILVDNASSEKDPEQFQIRFPNIRLIKSEVNLGFAKGNNLAVSRSKGEVVLLLNSDTELKEDAISICYKELMKDKQAGIITCKLVYPDGRLQHNCQSFPSFAKQLLEKMRFHKLLSKENQSKIFQGFYWDYSKPGYPDWVWGTFFMFKKELIQKLPENKLNEDYFMYVEDMKWCFDAKQVGYRILYSNSTSVLHLHGASGAASNGLIMKNYLDFLKRNYSFINYWLLRTVMFK